MPGKTNLLIRVGAFSIAMGVAALTANAADSTFNLPMEVHWGKAVLQPGVHHIEVPTPMTGAHCVMVTNGKERDVTVPIVTQPISTDRSFLRLKKVDGVFYVEEFQSGFDSRSYSFQTPRPKRSLEAADDTDAVTFVAVDSH